jgi:hypothetical protein
MKSEASTIGSKVKEKLDDITIIFDNPATRTPDPLIPDGPLLGNGDLGACLSGTPSNLRFWLSKCDFWKAKGHYPQGGPRLFGGLDIRAEGLLDAVYHVEQQLYEPMTIGRFAGNRGTLHLEAWTPAEGQALIVTLRAEGGPLRIETELWAKPGDGGAARSWSSGPKATAARIFEGAELEWPSGMAASMHVMGKSDTSFQLADGEEATLIVAFATRETHGSFLIEAAQAEADRLAASSLANLREDHAAWWRTFWEASYVDIGDDLIEKYYYGGYYLLACCSRNPAFPPGLYGNWITGDTPEWAGDYHLNYNYQAPWWGVYGGNRIGLAEPYDRPLLDYMERGRRYAREYADRGGLYYDVGIGPKGLCTSWESKGPAFHYQKSNAAFGAVNMLMRWRALPDMEYGLRIHPYLDQAALFWEEDLVDEDGFYHVVDDCLNEVGPWDGPDWMDHLDRNNVLTLGLIRMLFEGLCELEKALGLESPRTTKQLDIIARLSPYPVHELDGEQRLIGAAKGLGSKRNHEMNKRLFMQGTVYPAGVVGRERQSEVYSLLKCEAEAMSAAPFVEAFNGFDTVYPAAARLGLKPELLLQRLRRKLESHGYPNLWVYQGGGGIETIGGITAGIQEMLMQSYEGVIRVFPCWPANRDAEFLSLRADGGVLVSASHRGGKVAWVELQGDCGGTAVIENPQPGSSVEWEDLGGARSSCETRLTIRLGQGMVVRLSFSA